MWKASLNQDPLAACPLSCALCTPSLPPEVHFFLSLPSDFYWAFTFASDSKSSWTCVGWTAHPLLSWSLASLGSSLDRAQITLAAGAGQGLLRE